VIIYGAKKYGRIEGSSSARETVHPAAFPRKTQSAESRREHRTSPVTQKASRELPSQLANPDPELTALGLDVQRMDGYFLCVYSRHPFQESKLAWPVFDRIRECLGAYKRETDQNIVSKYRFIAAKTADGKPSDYWWCLHSFQLFKGAPERPVVECKVFGILWDSRLFTKDQICWIGYDKYEELCTQSKDSNPETFLTILKRVLGTPPSE
jgi:hypothetical protein